MSSPSNEFSNSSFCGFLLEKLSVKGGGRMKGAIWEQHVSPSSTFLAINLCAAAGVRLHAFWSPRLIFTEANAQFGMRLPTS